MFIALLVEKTLSAANASKLFVTLWNALAATFWFFVVMYAGSPHLTTTRSYDGMLKIVKSMLAYGT